MNDEATYVCDNCGEEIVVPIDPSTGVSQEYVEDCPVCCDPNVIHGAILAFGYPPNLGSGVFLKDLKGET